MKTARIFLISVLFAICLGCDSNESDPGIFNFEAEVIGQGMDCGETFVISMKNISDDDKIPDGTYYAYILPEALKVDGLEIVLNCRLPNPDEMRPCTMLGPSFPHVWVQEAQPKGE